MAHAKNSRGWLSVSPAVVNTYTECRAERTTVIAGQGGSEFRDVGSPGRICDGVLAVHYRYQNERKPLKYIMSLVTVGILAYL